MAHQTKPSIVLAHGIWALGMDLRARHHLCDPLRASPRLFTQKHDGIAWRSEPAAQS